MSIIGYLRKNGVKHALDVIYQYKIDLFLQKLMLPFLKKKPLKDVILIESHDDFDCNGGAFYDYLIAGGYHRKYKIVWLLKHKIPKKLPPNVEAFHLYKPGIKKDYYICRAKYFLADNVVTNKVRKEQLSFYLCHGAFGLKNFVGMLNLPESVDYIASSSKNYDPILSVQVGRAYPNQSMIHTGYPFHDVIFQEHVENEVKKISDKEYRKTIIWMPTFRKGGGFRRNDSVDEQPLGLPLIKSREMLQALQDYLEKENVLMVIKIHPKQDPSTIKDLESLANIKVVTGLTMKELNLNNYRMIRDADALISDYSSIAYSFLLLNRPIGFVLSDLSSYKLGLVVDNPDEFIVGPKIYTFEDFISFCSDVVNGRDAFEAKRKKVIDWLYEDCDGNSCARLADFMGLERPK